MRDQHVSIRATILQKKKPAALDVIKNDKPADLALYHILIFSLRIMKILITYQTVYSQLSLQIQLSSAAEAKMIWSCSITVRLEE